MSWAPLKKKNKKSIENIRWNKQKNTNSIQEQIMRALRNGNTQEKQNHRDAPVLPCHTQNAKSKFVSTALYTYTKLVLTKFLL